jgi:hypothetical protein
MNDHLKEREVTFAVEDGCLVRTVTGAGGRSYTHRCSKHAFEKVAHAIEETPAEGEGTSLIDVVGREDLPFTQVNVALEFLKERGLVGVRHRRCYPATRHTHLDAMVEFHALAEAAKGS